MSAYFSTAAMLNTPLVGLRARGRRGRLVQSERSSTIEIFLDCTLLSPEQSSSGYDVKELSEFSRTYKNRLREVSRYFFLKIKSISLVNHG